MRRLSAMLSICVLVAAVFTACSKSLNNTTAAELLNLGEKYLLEMNYEQAIVQFTKLIEVEPKNERAYIGAAEAYIGLGQIDKAVEILEQGLLQIPDSSKIADMLAAIAEPEHTVTEQAPPRELYADIVKALLDFEETGEVSQILENHLTFELLSPDAPDSTLLFALYDINGDGTEELLLAADKYYPAINTTSRYYTGICSAYNGNAFFVIPANNTFDEDVYSTV